MAAQSQTDLYGLFGVSPQASPDEIKKAYHRLAKTNHPDVGGDPNVFRAIAFAYEILSDPDKRAAFDRDGTIEDKPDNSHRAALAVIEGLFREVLDLLSANENSVAWNGDIVARMRERIGEILVGMDNAQSKMRRDVTRLTEFEKRFETPAGKKNYFVDMIRYRVRDIEKGIERIGADRERHLQALDLIDGCTFKVDPEQGLTVEMSAERSARAGLINQTISSSSPNFQFGQIFHYR